MSIKESLVYINVLRGRVPGTVTVLVDLLSRVGGINVMKGVPKLIKAGGLVVVVLVLVGVGHVGLVSVVSVVVDVGARNQV
jgi:hypothetical protein